MSNMMRDWTPPEDWIKITTIDAHTAGEPFRVITGGFPELPGETILERRRYAQEHLDHLRTALMWEPRGHADMYGCIVTAPVSAEADIGILFLHNEGYSTMCGHGIIGIVKVALETGMLPMHAPETEVKIDTPAGLVTSLTPSDFRPLIEKGMAIKRAVMESRPIVHPFEKDMSFLYGTIFISPLQENDAHSRNVCIFAEGEVDRCPTGTGVSARLAIHHARDEVAVNATITIESIIGTRFSGRILRTTTFGPYPAVIPEVTGTAHITGRNEFWIDPSDPLRDGFILR